MRLFVHILPLFSPVFFKPHQYLYKKSLDTNEPEAYSLICLFISELFIGVGLPFCHVHRYLGLMHIYNFFSSKKAFSDKV